MYSHSVFNAKKTGLKELDFTAWRVDRKKDMMDMAEKSRILARRPRLRTETRH